MKKKPTPKKVKDLPAQSTPRKAALKGTRDREIVITRVVNALPELVFKVWTDPRHVVKWWGPNGFTTTMQIMDIRPGGKWEFVMHGPDGTDYVNKYIIHEVVRPSRLVYTHLSAPKFMATINFVKHGTQTLVTMTSVFSSPAMREKVIKVFHAVEGGNQHLTRLNEYVTNFKG